MSIIFILELLTINDVTLDVGISFLTMENLKEAVNSERADSLRISAVSTSFTIAGVEWGDSIIILLSGVVVMAMAEYITWRGCRHRGCLIGWKWYFSRNRWWKFYGCHWCQNILWGKVSRLAVTTFLTGEKYRISPEGSARKMFLSGSLYTPLCLQAS